MFERVILLLLSGEFICNVSHPDEFRFLSNDGERADVAAYLGRIGRRLTMTPHQSGYYVAFSRIGPAEREAIKSGFSEVKGSLAPIVLFFQLIMRTTGREDLLMHGAMIESSDVMAKIDRDPGLRAELQTVAIMSRTVQSADGSHRAMLERMLRKLRDQGYLTLVNVERGMYQVTSKVEYLLDVVRFLQENEPAMKDAGGDDESSDATKILL